MKDKKRVCIIRRSYYPADLHVKRNADCLVSNGYSVDLICLRNKNAPRFENMEGVCVHRVPLRARRKGAISYLYEYLAFFFLAFLKVTVLHLKNSFDVVEADSMPDFLIFAGLVPRLSGSRMVLYLMESMPELWAQKRNLPLNHPVIKFIRWQENISCRFAHAVICCHELARQEILKTGIPAEKITAVLNVPDGKNFFATDPPAANDEVFRIVQHGTITKNYGIQVVLKALKRLGREFDVRFDVIGAGEYRPVLEKMVVDFGLQGRVFFHGYVPLHRLQDLLRQATAGVVPMLYEFQSPNKLFEYAALGIPVVASDRKTFKQHFSEDQVLYFRTGDLESLASVIRRVYTARDELKAARDKASLRFENYRWDIEKNKYLGLYQGLNT
jgi:glycosyltransferase involved in cell wall biosynthesis